MSAAEVDQFLLEGNGAFVSLYKAVIDLVNCCKMILPSSLCYKSNSIIRRFCNKHTILENINSTL